MIEIELLVMIFSRKLIVFFEMPRQVAFELIVCHIISNFYSQYHYSKNIKIN